MVHSLHVAVFEAIQRQLDARSELLRDPACGGDQHLPLFIGERRGRDTRMCLVDLLVLSGGQVRVIVEIEESGFLPTKICGKFLQAALATHFIHDSRPELAVPYAARVHFVQVLDGSKCVVEGGRKRFQGSLIKKEIHELLPLKGKNITDYHLFFVSGAEDRPGLEAVAAAVSQGLRAGESPDELQEKPAPVPIERLTEPDVH